MPARPHKPLPSQERLLRHFTYNPDTGELHRIRSDSHHILGLMKTLSLKGYIQVGFDRFNWKAHRIIWMMVTGEDPGESEIDHRDGVGHHNWWKNLRKADRSEQVINTVTSTRNTSGVKGVSPVKTVHGIQWGAKISIYRVGFSLLQHETFEKAAEVRLSAELAIHGEFRKTDVHGTASRLGITLVDPATILARQHPWPRLKPPEPLLELLAKVRAELNVA